MMSTSDPNKARWGSYQLGLIGLAVAFGAPLVAFAVTGLNMRYSGDDYCYAGLFRQQGLLKTIWSTYTGPSPFHGNRISLTLSSGIADAAGPWLSGLLPLLMLALWILGLVILMREIASAVGVRLKTLEPVVVAEALILVTLLITPQIEQSLYWRSGMLPYLMPAVLYSYIAALIIRQSGRSRLSLPLLSGIFGLSLVTGAYSETAAVVQLSLLVIPASALAVGWRKSLRGARTVWFSIGAAAAGTILAIGILILSPSNDSRLAMLDQAENLRELIRLTLFHSYLYSRSVVPSQLVPLVLAFAVSVWLTMQVGQRSVTPLIANAWECLLGLGIIGVTLIGTIAATMLPSALAQSSYPVGRALLLAAFAIVAAAGAAGALFGSYLVTWPERRSTAVSRLAGLSIAIAGLYALLATIGIYEELPRYQRWARFWDLRHARIVEERRSGSGDIEVVLIDHIIPDVAELSPDPNFFYNNCAEWYYDVQSLAANQPGWDEQPSEKNQSGESLHLAG